MRTLTETRPKLTALFVKYTGDLTSWRFTPSGGSGTDFTRTVPDEITNYAGETVSLQVDGFKHDLYLMTADQTATSVRMRFTGTNVQIVAILLLELLQEIDANASEILAVDARQVDRTGRIDTSPIGRVERFSKNVRKKQAVELSIKVVPGETLITDIDEFVFMLEDHTHIVLAEAFSERPELVFPRYYFINPNTGSLSIGLQAAWVCGGCLYIGAVDMQHFRQSKQIQLPLSAIGVTYYHLCGYFLIPSFWHITMHCWDFGFVSFYTMTELHIKSLTTNYILRGLNPTTIGNLSVLWKKNRLLLRLSQE